MAELKLSRLPERTPVNITFKASPELDLKLRQYAGLYRATYGQAEAVADLVPFMLEAFLESDRGFAKAVKEGAVDGAPVTPAHRRGRKPAEASPASNSSDKQE
jgi:hypothetical protein